MPPKLTLYLIRHGKASARHVLQASSGEEGDPAGYDRLDAIGVEQARLLGAALAERGVRFSRVFCGPLERQKLTLAHMRAEAERVGATWPCEELRENLREVALDKLVQEVLPRFLAEDEALRALWTDAEHTKVGAALHPESPLARVVARIALAWREGKIGAEGVEAWASFRERALTELHEILRLASGEESFAVVSSMAVISCMLEAAGAAPGEAPGGPDFPFLWLGTASLSVLSWDGSTLSTQACGDVSHLRGRDALLTVL